MTKYVYRKIQSYLALISLFVLLASIYLQYIVGLLPCPLCLMQRFCVFLLLIIMGLSLGTKKKAHLVSLMQIIVAVAGLYFSLRLMWLQSLPVGQAPACMPGLDVLIHYFPWQTVVKTLFWGTGDCAETPWNLFGISLAGWCTLYFSVMVLTGFLLYFSTRSLLDNAS